MRLLNFTPHEITLYDPLTRLVIRRLPPAGLARVAEQRVQSGAIDGIPVTERVFGDVQGLPQYQPGTILIVGVVVLGHVGSDRFDVVAPDTGSGAVRDSAGRVIGTTGFVRLAANLPQDLVDAAAPSSKPTQGSTMNTSSTALRATVAMLLAPGQTR